jgi:hypothetical protein
MPSVPTTDTVTVTPAELKALIMRERVDPEFSRDDHQEWIAQIQASPVPLTAWEHAIVTDLGRQGGCVSRAQERALVRILARVIEEER